MISDDGVSVKSGQDCWGREFNVPSHHIHVRYSIVRASFCIISKEETPYAIVGRSWSSEQKERFVFAESGRNFRVFQIFSDFSCFFNMMGL
jgi:hypothetical protein